MGPALSALTDLHAGIEAERSDLASTARQPLEIFSLDLADTATDEFDHDMALCQLSHEQNALYEIDQAMKRIESGTLETWCRMLIMASRTNGNCCSTDSIGLPCAGQNVPECHCARGRFN